VSFSARGPHRGAGGRDLCGEKMAKPSPKLNDDCRKSRRYAERLQARRPLPSGLGELEAGASSPGGGGSAEGQDFTDMPSLPPATKPPPRSVNSFNPS